MSAAADLAAHEIRAAPPLHLPPGPAAGARRGPAPRRRIRWGAPLTAAAAVVALAISLVIVKGAQNDSTIPSHPATSTSPVSSTSPAAPTGPVSVPRYYAALTQNSGIVVGDSVTGKTLAELAPPADKPSMTYFRAITAAGDDRTFVVLALTYPKVSASLAATQQATVTASWFEVQLAPGTAHPARLTRLPIKPQPVISSAIGVAFATALSESGQELAVTGVTASGGLAVQVFSVASGQLLHEWTTNDPSLSLANSLAKGIDGQPALTWIDGDRVLAVETGTSTPASGDLGFGAKEIVLELNVAGPSSGDLLTDGKVVWNVQTWEHPVTLLQACTGGRGAAQFISADGTTFGCSAVTGPFTDPNLSFLTYPLTTGATVAKQATVDYQVTDMAQKGVSTQRALWISPSGDAIIGAWITEKKGSPEDAPNGLHIGVMSRGKLTQLRFPPGFDQDAIVTTITW
jgi:hypothetical protein